MASGDDNGLSAITISSVESKHGFQVIVKGQGYPIKTSYGVVQATESSHSDVNLYSETLGELLLYPRKVVDLCNIKTVSLCNNLSVNGQLRSAVPDFEHCTLHLDIAQNDSEADYPAHVLHHELFHFIDLKDDGKLYTDDRWAAINPAGFRYKGGGARVRWQSRTLKPTPGFVSFYAMASVEEDKAETFAYMMVQYKRTILRSNEDPVLKKKIIAIEELLKQFCPELNASFWQTVSDFRRRRRR